MKKLLLLSILLFSFACSKSEGENYTLSQAEQIQLNNLIVGTWDDPELEIAGHGNRYIFTNDFKMTCYYYGTHLLDGINYEFPNNGRIVYSNIPYIIKDIHIPMDWAEGKITMCLYSNKFSAGYKEYIICINTPTSFYFCFNNGHAHWGHAQEYYKQ